MTKFRLYKCSHPPLNKLQVHQGEEKKERFVVKPMRMIKQNKAIFIKQGLQSIWHLQGLTVDTFSMLVE